MSIEMNHSGTATLSVLVIMILTFSIYPISAQSQTQATTLSPLKQLESGILAQDVKCSTGFVLVIKSSSGNPSCVRPATEQRLLAHGWTVSSKIVVEYTNNDKIINTTTTTKTHQTVPIVNGIRNTTIASDTDNGTITANMIYKWYNDSFANGPVSQLATDAPSPLQSLQVIPIISSNQPNAIKILLIGMSPNQLKVGDKPRFTLTYQNISDKPIYAYSGSTVTPIGLVMSPSDNALMMTGGNQVTSSNHDDLIQPNQINTNVAWPDPTGGHLDLGTFRYSGFDYGMYQITKPGLLHVTMELFLRTHGPGDQYDIMETVQFDVNATQ